LASPPEVHRYGDRASQFCELYGDAERVAVLIHGGFWRERYGLQLEGGLVKDLVARGWAVWNIEYRRLGGDGGWPGTFEDVEAAIRALPVEASRTVAIGHSAGGHLAVWAAAEGLVDAAVSQAGALDLDELSRLGTSDNVVNQLLAGTPEEVPHRYARASPRRLLPIGVPLLLVHGERDDVVPVHISRGFAAAAREAGDDCELVVIDDESHYEHLEPGSRCWGAVIERL
jgi:dipeptidyl aminopeptidase/acylaminoacyl peptidase